MLPFADYYYHRFGSYLKHKFGTKVHKISIDAGFDCPNRTPGKNETGCAWCENSSFNPNPRSKERSVSEQAELGVKILRKRLGVGLFIAYFQAYTNTYAPTETLYQLYSQALSTEGIVGLAIGTRPDCIDTKKLDMLAELARKHYVLLEYGLQTASNQTLTRMNRGHTVEDYIQAMELSRGRGIELCTHIITHLPGEGRAAAFESLHTALNSGTDGLKLHNLHIVKDSRLGSSYQQEPFYLPSKDEHVNLVCDLLEVTPPEIIIHRLWGAATTRQRHIAPDWCLDHNGVRYAIEQEFARRGSFQGSRLA